MRDAHRMKEKIDLTLDNRQIVSVVIGGIVVLGAVFVLGVVVGKKLAGNQHAFQSPDLLTALDQRSAALQEVRREPALTFQDELTRKMPEPPRDLPKPAVKAPEHPKAPAALAVAEPGTTSPASEPRRDAEPVTKPKAAEPKVEGKVESGPVPVRTAGTATASTLPRRPTETVANGPFTLQLGASPNRDDADRQVSKLRDRGYAPYIVAAQIPGKGTMYRVRMGSFPSKEAATHYLTDFRRETQLEAFVAATK